MKANEVPEKLYFSSTEDGTHYYTEGIPFEREYVEYVCKDAFIEKASTWIANRYQANGSYLNADDIEDFEKYMRGEQEMYRCMNCVWFVIKLNTAKGKCVKTDEDHLITDKRCDEFEKMEG